MTADVSTVQAHTTARETEPAYETINPDGSLRQGDILSEVIEYSPTGTIDDASVELVTYPLLLLITQDCDLERDFVARQDQGVAGQLLDHLLFLRAHPAERLRAEPGINAPIWKSIKKNNNIRYQFLDAAPAEMDDNGTGLPELALDFRQSMSLPTSSVYQQLEEHDASRLMCLCTPYRHSLQQRFLAYLGRIALPLDHQSE